MEKRQEQEGARVVPPGHSDDAVSTYMASDSAKRAASYPERMGQISGVVSAGFGLVQLLAPGAFARVIGMPFPPWVIRTVGARDLAIGLAMLAKPEAVGWRRARLFNDILDTGLIAAAALMPASERRRLMGFAAVAAAVIALDYKAAAAR